jgi:hypothetical protein
MEKDFSDENMEEFLRRNADGLRMRPSSRVWKGISSHLNRRRRRTGFILGASLLLATALGYNLMNESSKAVQNTSANTSTRNERLFTKQQPQLAFDDSKKLLATNNPQRTNKKPSTSLIKQGEQSDFAQAIPNQNEAATGNAFTPTIVDSYFENESREEHTAASSERISLTDPLSIESVVNAFKTKTRKVSWQIYFTPTVSYRKLSDNYIDNVATHKPAFGFQMGLAAKYPTSKNVKLKAGLQFNVNRYEIKTYDSYTQLATIRLNDRNGVDYVRTATNYNNFSGYKSNWLQNFYFQVSAPVGVELKIKGDDKMQFGIASTIQPTYLLGDQAYLISADYKNYAEMPKLVRRWNINTNFETFVTYSTGHLNWQVGPQVRYQLLSSYLKKYPVKENLFDFGLKVGISINKQQ